MPEDDFETTELKEKLEETTEHALEGAEQPVRWVVYLSFTTAIIAVFAAIAALESGSYANEALLQKNEAVLAQAKASDQWAYYQAKSVNSTIYTTLAAASNSSNPDLAAKAEQEAEKYATGEAEASKAAEELGKEAHEETELSGRSLEHHHRFAYAVTMFQVSIALAAVAALSREKAIWLVGLMISILGIVYFLDGFWLFF